MKTNTRVGWILVSGFLALGLLYVFQRFSIGGQVYSSLGWTPNENNIFMINKTIRLIANDVVCCWMIFMIFESASYRKVALGIFLLELVVILPIYFLLKLNLEGTSEISSPLLSFIHRLIVNPMLMVLTGIALAYQKFIFPMLPKS